MPQHNTNERRRLHAPNDTKIASSGAARIRGRWAAGLPDVRGGRGSTIAIVVVN